MTRVRAAVHVHSTWSYDGTWELEPLAAAFARRGYDAVLMTEHDRGWDADRWDAYREACARVSSTLVPGIEYSDADNAAHVLTWGELPFLGEERPTGDLVEEADARGGACVLAHPARREVHERAGDWLGALAGIEVWNRKSDGWAPSAAGLGLAARAPGLVAVAGLDFHIARQFFPLALELEVDGPVSAATVAAALRAGRARARAFRLPAGLFARGPLGGAARAAEAGRRPAARVVRRVRRG